MTIAAARDYLLQVENPAESGTWKTIGGLRGKTRTYNHEGIETTNHGSNGNKEFLDGGGIFSAAFSGEGVSNRDAESLQYIEDNMKTGALLKLRLVDTGTGGRTHTASWHISSYEDGGQYNEAVAYTIQGESSGAVTTTETA